MRRKRKSKSPLQLEASRQNFRIRRLRAFQGSLKDLFNPSAAAEINEMIEHSIKEIKNEQANSVS